MHKSRGQRFVRELIIANPFHPFFGHYIASVSLERIAHCLKILHTQIDKQYSQLTKQHPIPEYIDLHSPSVCIPAQDMSGIPRTTNDQVRPGIASPSDMRACHDVAAVAIPGHPSF